MAPKISTFLHNLTPAQEALGDEYLQQFLEPIIDGELGQKCANCGFHITGTLGVANFTQPLIIGAEVSEGTCYECGHPFRFIHNIPGLGEVRNLPLQFVRRIN